VLRDGEPAQIKIEERWLLPAVLKLAQRNMKLTVYRSWQSRRMIGVNHSLIISIMASCRMIMWKDAACNND
jgi:hypothetical protein